MPRPTAILETVLYTDDLDRAARFYEEVMGLAPLFSDARMRAFDVAGRGVLLIFVRGATRAPMSGGDHTGLAASARRTSGSSRAGRRQATASSRRPT